MLLSVTAKQVAKRASALRVSARTAVRAFSAEVGERPEPQVCDSLTQIGSRRIYSAEHDMYREMLRAFY